MFLCTCCTIMFVPQNKESRREVAASAAWLRTTGCEHPPVRTAAPSARDREGGCASSVSPQSCAKTNSVPAWLSAKPSMHVWVHERGEEGFLPFDSTFLLRIWHSFLSSAIHTHTMARQVLLPWGCMIAVLNARSPVLTSHPHSTCVFST